MKYKIYSFVVLLALVVFQWPAHANVESQFQKTKIGNSELYYSFPKNYKAITYVFHGKNGSAQNFFDKHDPKIILQEFLNKGYALVLFDSDNRSEKRWNVEVSESNRDLNNFDKVEDILRGKGFDLTKPRYAMGMSNGGVFTSVISHVKNLKAGVIFSSKGRSKLFRDYTSQSPRLFFAHATNDPIFKREDLLSNVNLLKAKNVDVERYELGPLPITTQVLQEYLGLSSNQASLLLQRFQSNGVVNHNMQLNFPVNNRGIRASLGSGKRKRRKSSGSSISVDRKKTRLFINKYAAKHTMFKEPLPEIFRFLEK